MSTENLITTKFNPVLQEKHFVTSQGNLYCLKVTCEDCEHITRCKNVPEKVDESLNTNIRRALATRKAPKGEYVGDTTKVVVRRFKDKPEFESERVLYDWENDNYLCVSGSCLGCEHIKICKPELEIKDSDLRMWSSDLKAQEPRCYAMLSKEPRWVELFQNDSIRSTPYLYEAVTNLFDIFLDSSLDANYWTFLDANFFEDRTDLYYLVHSIANKDIERFTVTAKYILLLFAKQYKDYVKPVQDLIEVLPEKMDYMFNKLAEFRVIFPPVGDFHGANAVALFTEEVVKTAYVEDYNTFKNYYRDKAKKCGLALNYGGTEYMVSRTLGVPEAEGKKFYDNYFSILHVFKKYLDKAWFKACKQLFIRTMVGRKIYIPELAITDRKFIWKKLNEGKNNVYNYPIQASGAEMIRIMKIKAYSFFTKYKLTKFDINHPAKVTQGTKLMMCYAHSDKLDELSEYIDKAETGNTLIIVMDKDNNVVMQADRSIRLKWSDAEYFNLKEVL